MFMHACERNTVYVGVLYSHGCCWVCLFLAYNNWRRWKVSYSCRLLCFVQFGRGFGGGAGARWANKRFVGDGGERRCSSRQRRKPWEASSPWNKTNKWVQWFKEGGTMRADGWAETRLSLQCPGSTSRPGLRSTR